MRDFGLRVLARRDVLVAEFRQKCTDKFPEKSAEIETVLVEFLEKNWLSDAKYCENFFHFKSAQNWGPEKIKRNLSSRGASESDISAAAGAFDKAIFQRIATALAQKKRAQIARQRGEVSELVARQKIQNFLFQRGFGAEFWPD